MEKWRRGTEYKSLKWYKKEKPGPEKWYDGSWGSQATIQRLEATPRRFDKETLHSWRGEITRCSKCGNMGQERVESLEDCERTPMVQ